MTLVVTWTCNIFTEFRGIPEFPKQFSIFCVESDYGFGHQSNDLSQPPVFEDDGRTITGFLIYVRTYPNRIARFRVESGYADVFSARRADHLPFIDEQRLRKPPSDVPAVESIKDIHRPYTITRFCLHANNISVRILMIQKPSSYRWRAASPGVRTLIGRAIYDPPSYRACSIQRHDNGILSNVAGCVQKAVGTGNRCVSLAQSLLRPEQAGTRRRPLFEQARFRGLVITVRPLKLGPVGIIAAFDPGKNRPTYKQETER